MYNVFKSESSIFKELDLFYHFTLLFSHILGKFYIIDFMGLQKHFKDRAGFLCQFSSCYYLHMNINILVITVDNNIKYQILCIYLKNLIE